MPSVEVFLPVDNISVYLLIAAVFEALAVYLFQFRKSPGALMLVCCQVSKGIWVLAKAFYSLSPDLPAKIFWARFTEWMPILLIYFWFEFIMQISMQRGRILKTLQQLVRGIVAALVLIIAFDNALGWYWGPVSFEGQVLTFAFGPAAQTAMIFCYVLNLVCLGLSIRWIYSTDGLRRRQAVVFSVTPLFNFIGNIAHYVLDLQAVSPQVVGLLLSAVYVTWVFYWWRIYSILPMAQEAVTRNLNDGLVVVDEKGYIVDMNPAAKTIFDGMPADVGTKFDQAAAAWPALSAIVEDSELETLEADKESVNERRIYQISAMLFRTPQGHMLGKTILFKDITEQKRDQAKLIDQQKALSVVAERERLGRELHDGRGQIWNYLNLELQTLRSFANNGELEKTSLQAERLIGLVKELNTDARESIVGLKRKANTDNTFIDNLRDYLAWYEESNGIITRLILPAESVAGMFSRTCEVQLLRIIQEALTNIRKHAKARQVKVIIQRQGQEAQVMIEDDGCGFDMAAVFPKKKSFGLQIMAERAEEAGGRLQVESKPGVGTIVNVQFSLATAEASEQ